MKVYKVQNESYIKGIGTMIDDLIISKSLFESKDDAREAMEKEGLNTEKYYKKSFGSDNYKVSVSDFFYHISDNEGETWDNFDIVEQELK